MMRMKSLCIILLLAMCLCFVGCGDSATYKEAMEAKESGEYEKALELFGSIPEYNDSKEMMDDIYRLEFIGEWIATNASTSYWARLLPSADISITITISVYKEGTYEFVLTTNNLDIDPLISTGTWEITNEARHYTIHGDGGSEEGADVFIEDGLLYWNSEGSGLIFKPNDSSPSNVAEANQGSVPPSTVHSVSEQADSASESVQDMVSVIVADKQSIEANPYEGRYQNRVDFNFNITNHTDKEIQGIQGVLDIRDLFGERIQRINCDFTGLPIAAGEAVTYTDLGVDINQFRDIDIKLYNTDYKDLKFEYAVKQVVFADGSILEA